MKGISFNSLVAMVVLLLLSSVPACSGGSSAPALSIATDTTAFWAADFSKDDPRIYQIKAAKVGEGAHCYIYLEEGAAISQDRIIEIINEFDNTIYPVTTATFGNEPNPGIDKDRKIHVLLLDIIDGYNSKSNPSYIAGYFDPGNEYPGSIAPYSNEKEMLYMDIYPANPGSIKFFNTLAHEFQHMIHWEQKAISDETWLNEAMSEIAPVYCGYGPSYSRVLTFQNAPSDSLTSWNGTVKDYGVVYMWAQYFKDRFEGIEPNIFRRMLNNDQAGIDAVNTALRDLDPSDPSLTFAGTFRDWTIANYSGNAITWPGHPEWSYRSAVTLPGLFPDSKQNPVSPLAPLGIWSVDYYSYTPASPDGTLTWTAANGSDKAVLIDPDAATQTELVSEASYTITTRNFLIVSNPSKSVASTGAMVTRTSTFSDATGIDLYQSTGTDGSAAKSPKAMLEEAARDHDVQERAHLTGECEAVCIHHYFDQKEKSRKANGARPAF